MVKAASRTTAAKVRSPRRLVAPGLPVCPVRSGEAVAVTGAPCRGGATRGCGGRDAVVPARVWSSPSGDLRDDRSRFLGQRRVERRGAGGVGRGLLAIGGDDVGEEALNHVGRGGDAVGGVRRGG